MYMYMYDYNDIIYNINYANIANNDIVTKPLVINIT